MFLDQLWWSWRHSRRRLFESALVILAVALGIGVIITVLSLFFAVGGELGKIGEESYYRTFHVQSKADLASFSGAPLVLLGEELPTEEWTATLSETEELQNNLPATMHVFTEVMWGAQTVLLDDAQLPEEAGDFPWFQANELTFLGTLPAYFDFMGYEAAQGSLFVQEDVLGKSEVAVLSAGLARALFGEEDPIGRQIPVEMWEHHTTYTVIGVLKPLNEAELDGFQIIQQARTAYVPATASPYGSASEGRFTDISIGIDPGEDLASALERAEGEVRLLWGDQIAVRSMLQDFSEGLKSLKRYAFIIGIFASVGLIIAVINILNLMLSRVLKRTKSVGLSMALGSPRRLVFRQFMIESSLLGIIGSALGVLFSFALGRLLETGLGAGFMPALSETKIFLGIGLGLLASLLFGSYPAYLAAKIDPVDALRAD